MAEEEHSADQETLPLGIGEKLRDARLAHGCSLEHVAAETRITERHLALIEAGDFAALPARTYAVGFSRSYARLLGLDEQAVIAEVRLELANLDRDRRARPTTFEPGDPARVPSARLAWISALAGVAIFVLGLVFVWNSFLAPAATLPWLTRDVSSAKPVPAHPAARPSAAAQIPRPASGPVVFTALEDGIWVKFYDRAGTQLLQKQLAKGENYTVPADADGPLLWTGRPDALAITVGGAAVPKLAETHQIVKDIPVSAAALLARAAPPVSASPTA